MKSLSIVTIGSAKEKGIYETIKSVLKQKEEFRKWVFVVFNQKEKEILNKFLEKESSIINKYKILFNSQGITQSLNLAIKSLLSDYSYIWILHAGDLALKKVSPYLQTKNNYDIFFFPVKIKSKKFSKAKVCYTSKNWKAKIRHTPCILHQGVVASSNIFKTYGIFDERYSSIMDYEWFYRISINTKKELRCIFYNYPIAEFILGGKSAEILLACKEHFFVYKKHEKSLIYSFLKALTLYFKKLIYLLFNFYIPKINFLKLIFIFRKRK